MHIPISTYRLQLSHHFTFADAEKILPYLQTLGITDIYISPILQAQSNSSHGYDVIDYATINADLGGEAGFKRFTHRLHAFKMNLLVDIVPNHMAATSQNKYWMDVIKHRKKSKYAYLFDVNWDASSDAQLSYRRFCDINELVCLRTEDPCVFVETHALILKLVHEGHIQGLRVDHIDGLRDPLGYLKHLATSTKRQSVSSLQVIAKQSSAQTISPSPSACYLVVEKVTAYNESLPNEWPVSGTTGYDFMSQLNQVFVHQGGLDVIIDNYANLTQSTRGIQDVITDCATVMMRSSFKHEFNQLLHMMHQIVGGDLFSLEELLLQCFAKFRRYRFYPNRAVKNRANAAVIHAVCKSIVTKNIEQHRQLVLVTDVLLLNFSPLTNDFEKHAWKKWHTDWEVFSGPLLAKSFEDTACYTYSPLMSLNEVGMGPEYYSTAGQLDIFHAYNAMKHSDWPHGINATSTHDTKRSEDVRARLNVLTELSQAWGDGLKRWSLYNTSKKTRLLDALVPDVVDELFIYQTLVGAWPVKNAMWAPTAAHKATFKSRLSTYITKAMRERKDHSSWAQPNVDYEDATQQFLNAVLTDADFLADFLPFQHTIAFYGMYNALMQLVLKTTCPGVADFYQGNETWRFDLVDPDNRHAVDFAALGQLASDKPLATLLADWQTGQIKFNLTQRLVQLREEYRLIFLSGEYIPLAVEGPHADHVLAFARKYKQGWIIVLTTRWLSKLIDVDQTWSSARFTAMDRILLPCVLHDYRSLMTPSLSMNFGRSLSVQQVLSDLPFNIIYARNDSPRTSSRTQ